MHNSMQTYKQIFIILISLCIFSCAPSGSDSADNDETITEKIQLVITWDDNSDNETGYIIERRLASSNTYDEIVMLSEDTNSYDDQSAFTGQTYCYQVSAYNQAGKSSSDEVCIAV